MIEFRPGDIVLATFPYTALEGEKARPCLVLAQCAIPEDFVVAYISSSALAASLRSSVTIEKGFGTTGLKVTSFLRIDKLYTLHRSVVIGKVGELPKALRSEVKSRLHEMFEAL